MAASLAEPGGAAAASRWPAGRAVGRGVSAGSWLAARPAWPVTALLAGYPLWWALGVADYMVIVLAVPMAARMLAWLAHGSRRVRFPPGFAIWATFLIVVLAGVFMLRLNAPGTVVSSTARRFASFLLRATDYGALTVLLLYVGNLTERELSRRKLARLLGLVAIYATVGGLGGILAPHFQFTSPLALLVPHGLQNSSLAGASLHPGFSQIQSVLGGPSGRPKAPFNYTNDWGNALSILLPWLLAGWWYLGSRRQRLVGGVAGVAAIAPIVYSLDRGVWIGTALSVCYLAVRLAARGKVGLLAAMCAGVALAGVVFLATPLSSVVVQRLHNGQSNSVRSWLADASVRDAAASPLLGYGDTRHSQGSPNSIAVGPTPGCPQCGQYPVGSDGQLWLLLICNGFLGAGLYLAFFGYGVWRYRHDATPYGVAGSLVLLLSFVYMFFYTAVAPVLAFTMLAYALLWRNDVEQSPARAQPAGVRA